VTSLEGRPWIVKSVTRGERRRNPAAPFITSTLQQEAGRKLHFTAKKTMMLAQQLYEGIPLGDEGAVGLITYMRTDAVRIAPEAQAEAREWVSQRLGREYLPDSPPAYRAKKSAQEAHEAVRPSSVASVDAMWPSSLPRSMSRSSSAMMPTSLPVLLTTGRRRIPRWLKSFVASRIPASSRITVGFRVTNAPTRVEDESAP
jgi:DNA topoisomerase-1